MVSAAEVEQGANQRPPMEEMRRGAVTGLATVVLVGLVIGLVSFDGMSFSEALGFVQLVSVLIGIMFLSIPIGAIYAIFRGRSNRPTGRSLFPHFVLWGWVLLLIGAVAYFLTGAWYSESGGPPPQEAAAQTALVAFSGLVCVVAIHIGLYRTTQPLQDS